MLEAAFETDGLSSLADMNAVTLSRPGQACADNMGVYWYNSKE
jgi:hypothetical protein